MVWDDKDGRYADVVQDVLPKGTSFARYEGSWFALRREIEPILSQPQPTPLVIYVGSEIPAQDPLEETRQAGTSWSPTLHQVLTKALGGELAPSRITALARTCNSLGEIEAALRGGERTDPRLVRAFGRGGPVDIALHVLSGDKDGIVPEDVWPLVAAELASEFGGSFPSDPAYLRACLFRHAALSMLAAAPNALPASLAATARPLTAQQKESCRQLLDRLKDPRLVELMYEVATVFDGEVTAAGGLTWRDEYAGVDVSPGMEDLALAEGIRRLQTGDLAGAQALATRRLASSMWAKPNSSPSSSPRSDQPYWRWRAIGAVAHLEDLAAQCRPSPGTPAELLTWYAEQGWNVDRSHRTAELARADLGHAGSLDGAFVRARGAYGQWLDDVAALSTRSVTERGLPAASLPQQSRIFTKDVATTGSQGLTAYFLVDALRFELGMTLAERLGAAGRKPPTCQPAVAAAPTITPVGMANLLPGAESGMAVALQDEKLVPSVGGVPVRNAGERIALLQREVGGLVDLPLTDLMNISDDALREQLVGADLLLVRSTAIDAAGESGSIGTAWRTVDGILDDLVNQILRLGHVGVTKVVVAADHGFIVLSSALGPGHVVERPGGVGDLHSRCWVGTGGVTPPGTVRLAMSDVGAGGGLDLVVPDGVAVFPLPGTRQFFHGGLSPQELVVPVITMALAAPDAAVLAPSVAITVAGRGITTGVFAATLTFAGSIFASEVVVRVMARTPSGTAPAARLVAGDGFDAKTGTVTVTIEPAVLTFQVTANLERATPVELTVLDATSGFALATLKVPVAAPVIVEDGW